MSLYIPNEGEKEILRGMLANMEINCGLYCNSVVADGTTQVDDLTELNTGSGRAYETKTLNGEVVEAALTDAKWRLTLNSSGEAEGQYGNTPLSWTMNAYDVDDAATIYGAFGYFWVLPFDGGITEVRPGDKIEGATSGATATAAMVNKISGTWGSNAAGYMWLRSKSGTFQNDENIIISGKISSVSVNDGGTGYAVGDIVEVTQEDGSWSLLVVTTVSSTVVTGLVVADGGQGFTVDTALATVAKSGSGNNDLTVDIGSLGTTAVAVVNTGTTGDAHKKLLFVDTFSESHDIDTIGLTAQYTPKITVASA